MADNSMIFGRHLRFLDLDQIYKETSRPEDIAFLEEQRVDKISVFSVPPLQHIVAVKISVTLWMHPDVIKVIHSNLEKLNFRFENLFNDFDLFLEKPRHMLSLLPLPYQLKQRVSNVLGPIGMELLQWMGCKASFLNSSKHINCIHWNMRGAVDLVATLEAQITSADYRGVETDYETASFYCMETYIPMLWEKMSKTGKKFYLSQVNARYCDHFMTYWTCVVSNQLQGFMSKVARFDPRGIYDKNSVQANMVSLCVEESNLIALKYFWHKLTAEEIIFYIEPWVHTAVQRGYDRYDLQRSTYECGVSFFLLSQLSLEAQRRWIISCSANILSAAFSVWPWQEISKSMIQSLMHFLDECSYGELICALIRNIRKGSNADALGIMLKSGSKQLKENFFRRISHGTDGPDLVWELVEAHDSETVAFIFDNIDAQDGKNIILQCIGNRSRMLRAINSTKFHMLDMLIGGLRLGHSEYDEMKLVVLRRCFNFVFLSWIRSGNWETADNFLRWGCTSQETIGVFKAKYLDKLHIVRSLVRSDDFELLEEFIKWYCSTEIEILNFKKECVSVKNVFSLIDCISVVEPFNTVEEVYLTENCFEEDSTSSSGDEERSLTYFEASKASGKTTVNEKPFRYRIFQKKDMQSTNSAFVPKNYVRDVNSCVTTYEIQWSIFKRYMRHFCCDGDDRQLRGHFADSKYLCNAMHLLLTVRSKHKLAQALLHWCFSTERDVARFKQELLVSEKGYSLFFSLIASHYQSRIRSWRPMRKLAQWFHPIPQAALDKFKALFVQKAAPPCETGLQCQKKEEQRAIFYLLDTFTRDTRWMFDTSACGSDTDGGVPHLLKELPDVKADPLELNAGIEERVISSPISVLKTLSDSRTSLSFCNCESMNKRLRLM